MMQRLAGHLLAASGIPRGLEIRDLIPGHVHLFLLRMLFHLPPGKDLPANSEPSLLHCASTES